MPTKFTDSIAELKREAKVEGPKAVAELKYFRERYRLARPDREGSRREQTWR